MNGSHRETLERYLAAFDAGDDTAGPDGPALRMALRALLDENERLQRSVEGWEEEARRSHQNVAWREDRISAALALHSEWTAYDECGHDHTSEDLEAGRCIEIPEVGLTDECGHDHTSEDLEAGRCIEIPEVGLTCEDGKLYTVCRECHTADGEPTEDTDEGEWPCPTVKALLGEEEE
jgi:hypothetical protein